MRATAVAVLLAGALALSACSAVADWFRTIEIVPHDAAALGGTEVAVYLSEQWRDFDARGLGTGYVVLIDGDGGVRAIRTAGMDEGLLLWTERGLAFSDVESDFLLADSLRVTASPKRGSQQALISGPDDSMIGLYNEGFTETGYLEHAVTTTDTGAISREVEGYYQVTGSCDGTLFGLAEPMGEYAEAAARLGPLQADAQYGYPTLMLSQLSGTSDGRERVVDMEAVKESNQWGSDAPCRDGELVYLAITYDADGTQRASLRVWSTRTGEQVERTLVTPDGEPIPVDEFAGFDLRPTALALRGEQLDWLGVDGVLSSTNLATGVTEALFAVETFGLTPTYYSPSHTFTEDTLAILTWEPENVHFAEYDRLTGELLREMQLPEVHAMLHDGSQVMRGMATRPPQE